MEVKLLTTPEHFSAMEHNAAYAMLICHANTEKLKSEKPETFLKRAIKAGHESVLEHITLTYEINNLSRACLQELARHRHISLSVESTRHTLKKQVEDKEKLMQQVYDILPTLIRTEDNSLTWHEVYINWLKNLLDENPDIKNDVVKYYLPEFWPTNLILTANVRELRHIVTLRTSPAALQEFQELARGLVEAVPNEFKYLMEDCVNE